MPQETFKAQNKQCQLIILCFRITDLTVKVFEASLDHIHLPKTSGSGLISRCMKDLYFLGMCLNGLGLVSNKNHV